MKNFTKLKVFLLIISVTLTSCNRVGPEPNFDVTGLWETKNNDSQIEFTEKGRYKIYFDPPLSDGTKSAGGSSYTRVDNGHLDFTVRYDYKKLVTISIVNATITSKNMLIFRLDDRTYRFTKMLKY